MGKTETKPLDNKPADRKHLGLIPTTKILFEKLEVPRKKYLIAFFLSLISRIFPLIVPFFLTKLVNYLTVLPENASFSDIKEIIFILMILSVGGVITNILTQSSLQKLGISTIYELRQVTFSHIQTLSLSYYNKEKTGKIMSFFTNDINNVNNLISTAFIQLLLQVIQLIGSLIFMFVVSYHMCLTLLVVFPIIIITTLIASKISHNIWKNVREAVTEVTGTIQELIDGFRTIKSMRTEKIIKENFEKSIKKEFNARSKAMNFVSIISPFNGMITYLSVGIALFFGFRYYSANLVNLGDILGFILYMQFFSGPLNQIANFFNSIQSSVVGGERLINLMEMQSEIQDPPIPKKINSCDGSIDFENVSFAYEKKDVLRNISVKIPSHSRIAIVGPTGAGKTTLAMLIPRFFDVREGVIKIDGINIKDVKKSSLRSNIGIVLQDNFLFSDTIMENIRFGKIEAADEEIINVCKKIGCHDFISNLPQGYQSMVGERGAILSLGQRQLIAFARTMLSNPPILILDEATSSVDVFSEILMQKALEELLQERTCIIIAHRLSTIKKSDFILVMEDGKIIQEGSHDDLFKKPGMYREFYQMQFAEEKKIEMHE